MEAGAGSRRLLRLWTAGLVALFLGFGIVAVTAQLRDRRAAVERYRARLDPNAAEPGLTAPETALPPGATPVQVSTGIYLDRIADLSVRDNYRVADFYVWSRSVGGGGDPVGRFEVVDGQVESRDTTYPLYRVVARITTFFDVSRFPRDDHPLVISLETPEHLRTELQRVPDAGASSASSRVHDPGYRVTDTGALFAAVANSYVTSSLIPEAGVLSLADVVNGLGVVVILLTLQSTVALRLYQRGEEELCRTFDRLSRAVFFVGYALLNLALPLAADS